MEGVRIARRYGLRALVVPLVVGVILVVFAIASFVSTHRPASQPNSTDVLSGPAFANSGPNWSENNDPLTDGQETTLSQAVSQAGYPLYTPNVSLASDSSVAHVWTAVVPADSLLLPNHPQVSVGLSYKSGIVVTYIPWQYGPNALSFSQDQAAQSYRQTASQSPMAGSMTVDSINGIPALVITQNVQRLLQKPP